MACLLHRDGYFASSMLQKAVCRSFCLSRALGKFLKSLARKKSQLQGQHYEPAACKWGAGLFVLAQHPVKALMASSTCDEESGAEPGPSEGPLSLPRRLTPAKGFADALDAGTPAVGVGGGAPVPPRRAFTTLLPFRISSVANGIVPLSSSWVQREGFGKG